MMLNTIRNALLLGCFIVPGVLQAEEHMQKARANLKDITLKRCNTEIAVSKELEGLNKDQFCQCSTDRFVDGLTNIELKQLFLKPEEAIFQQRQNEAATYCMANNSNAAILFDRIFYKGCVDGSKEKSNTNSKLNIEEYCGCTSKKLSSNLSQQDMQDFIRVGKEPGTLVDTGVSDKMMNYATECLSQMVNNK